MEAYHIYNRGLGIDCAEAVSERYLAPAAISGSSGSFSDTFKHLL
jgi:hypothetical protein